MWQVEYSDAAEANLLRLDQPVGEQLLRFFRDQVAAHPEPKLLAEPLSGTLRTLWRFRIGDYRAIRDIRGDKVIVGVPAIGHRSEIYR